MASRRMQQEDGLLPWQQSALILEGVRQLSAAVVAADSKMQREPPGAALLQQVVVDGDQSAAAELSGTTVEATVDSSVSPSGRA